MMEAKWFSGQHPHVILRMWSAGDFALCCHSLPRLAYAKVGFEAFSHKH
jgi:hypothetical protein